MIESLLEHNLEIKKPDGEIIRPKFPIIQGGMAVRVSLAPLATAVAKEGGIGVIALSGLSVEESRKHIRKAKLILGENYSGILGVNIMFVLQNFFQLVEISIEEKVDVIISGAGFSRDAFRICQETNILYIPIVSQVKGAVISEKMGAPAVIVESGEAGGHLGTDQKLFNILPEIVKAVKIPIIAAGGIIYGWDIKKAFDLGASGVQLGTRFALSKECSAHINWKNTLLSATKKDLTSITTPVGMTFRAVRNYFVREIEKGHNFKELSREFETKTCDSCVKTCQRDKFCILHALERAQEGDIKTGLITCGERVEEIKEIFSVKEIFQKLCTEFSQAI